MASPAFSDSGDLHTAQSETYVYADTATAEHWFAEFSSRRTRACLARLIRKEGAAAVKAEGFTLGPITARSIPVAPVGDQDEAFRVTVPFSGSGVTLKVDADVVFVRAGRGIATFSLAALGSPFAPGARDRPGQDRCGPARDRPPERAVIRRVDGGPRGVAGRGRRTQRRPTAERARFA
jgi:hypothetical protein